MSFKEKIVFDAEAPEDTDNIGAYLRSADGTLLTHTTVGDVEALDVYLANTSIAVTATDLDIRDLTHATDSISIGDGTETLAINADGSINVVAEDASNYAEDEAHTSGDVGKFVLAVRKDTEGALAGTDGDYAPLQVDALGRLRVAADIDVATGFEKIEDTAHADAAVGAFILSVREDELAESTSAEGDYQAFKTDALGRLYTNATHQTMAFDAVEIDDAEATDLAATDLENRKKIIIQNVGTVPVYIGDDSVTAATGLRLSGGGVLELEVGPGVDLHAIAPSGKDGLVRIMELA